MKKLKWAGIAVAGFFALGIIGMLLGVEPMEFEPKAEQPEKNERVEKVEVAKEEEPKETVSEPVASEEKKVKTPVEVKEVKEVEPEKSKKEEKKIDPVVAEKNYYLKDVKPTIQDQLDLFDAVWKEVWQPTFEGVGNGNMSAYDAYGNMKKVESHYDLLHATLGEIEGKELSKKNKKTLKEFRVNIQSAARWRSEAAKHAKDMFNEGDYSPSQLEKVQEYVKTADSKMLSAIVNLSEIESNLGIINE